MQAGIRKLLNIDAMRRIRWIPRKGVLPDNWLRHVLGRKPRMVAAVAWASKMARVIRAISRWRKPAVFLRSEPASPSASRPSQGDRPTMVRQGLGWSEGGNLSRARVWRSEPVRTAFFELHTG